MRQVTPLSVEEIYMARRRNYLNFTMDQIVSIVDHINIKDCAMNQIVYQGAQCLLCPLIAPSGKSCYRDMGFIVK